VSSSSHNLSVLFADVVGSTRLYERLGDTNAFQAISTCLAEIERATKANKGRVVKTIGDEIMAVFPCAEDAMNAACEMQLHVDKLPQVSGIKLAIRIGFHHGPLLHEDNDFFGDAVNIAARMAGLSKGQQIITNSETASMLPLQLKQSTRPLYEVSVKGKSEPIRLIEVIWHIADQDLTMMPTLGHSSEPSSGTRLRLVHGSHEMILDAGLPSVVLGRDVNSDLVITDPLVSRAHCSIERRQDKFVLADKSSNGTYVTFVGEEEFVLRREETLLRGLGRISFGHPYGVGGDEFVGFEVMGRTASSSAKQ